MARTTKNDELNILDYFSEMNLPQEEIDKRISLALLVKEMYQKIFEYIRIKDELDTEFIEEYLVGGYAEIFGDGEYQSEHAKETAYEVLEATSKHLGDNYYTSDARATLIAVNDANSIGNYEYEQSFIKKGYTRKRWDALNDNKVRHSHIIADGQEVGINELFEVGSCKMRFPMDTEYGSASECVNCRCVCSYIK